MITCTCGRTYNKYYDWAININCSYHKFCSNLSYFTIEKIKLSNETLIRFYDNFIFITGHYVYSASINKHYQEIHCNGEFKESICLDKLFINIYDLNLEETFSKEECVDYIIKYVDNLIFE